MKLGEQYAHLVITPFDHWTLVLHENQGYPGRCYAWFNDQFAEGLPLLGEGLPMHQLPSLANKELMHHVYPLVIEAHSALGYTTSPYAASYLLNMEYLANNEGHNHQMHWHFTPRTRSPVAIACLGRSHADMLWGHRHNPRLVPHPALRPEEVEAIRATMAGTIRAHI
jgi:diadenosine tetraphosphate (Ap4A) HIT family hydrolase